MSRKHRQGAHGNHERWMVSYADFMTLLFAFFVVLYSSSQVDKAKMGKLAAAIEGAFQQMGVFNGSQVGPPLEFQESQANGRDGQGEMGSGSGSIEGVKKIKLGSTRVIQADELNQKGLTQPELRSLKQELESALAAEISRREVALHIGPEGLVVSLREMGFFDSGSAVLKPGSELAISRVASLLRQRQAFVRVEGHTDVVPIHTAQFNSNWELSTARATEMLKLLISSYAFPPGHLSAAGYGEFHPVADNASAEGRRQNRRVDLVILGARNSKAQAGESELPHGQKTKIGERT